jgi:hypothetical protein
MTGLPSLKDLVACELARCSSTERAITIRRIVVKPIYDGTIAGLARGCGTKKALSWTSTTRGSAPCCV